MKYYRKTDTLILNTLGAIILGFFGLFCLFPFILLISGSFSSEGEIIRNGYSFLPRGLTLEAYRTIFNIPKVIANAYGVTVFVTVVGTLSALFITTMTAYVLSRKDFIFRNAVAFYFYFTTLFSGGLLSYYILIVRYLHLKDQIITLILPGLLPIMYVIMMRSFITTSIPESIIESARIDGAGDFRIFWSIVRPTLTPAIASIGLFISLGYWNDWWNAMLFIDSEELRPLQYVLYKILSSALYVPKNSQSSGSINIVAPKETLKLALTFVVTGPILLAYPFVQKYFVKGITLGAVKG
jgi:putative aldouronate transport system permease protein